MKILPLSLSLPPAQTGEMLCCYERERASFQSSTNKHGSGNGSRSGRVVVSARNQFFSRSGGLLRYYSIDGVYGEVEKNPMDRPMTDDR
mmetsp:Transcript_20020/g.22348  ORF Transcript_20020/g.22348 Transcript_20020/m.22348 type:complete len:89 (+) Transcript_20020:748-1014(+)